MAWYQRWRNVFRSERLDGELENELQYHLAETIDRLVEDGMSEKEATREARQRLGNYSIQKERTRDMNISAWLDATRADLLYGLRQLRLNPGFTAIAVLSLALGIGANSAMFQLINAIRMKMLPVRNPQELVLIDYEKGSSRGGSWSARNAAFTYAQWQQIRTQQQAFSGVLAWSPKRFNLTNGGEPKYAEGVYVSGDFFQLLGVKAILGRTLTESDDSATCNAGAVLSHAFWQREFGSDPQVLGRTLSLDGFSVPVIGVTGPAFFGVEVGSRYDLAIPLCADRLGRMTPLSAWWLGIMGRLKPGWTVKSADAHMRTLSPGIMRATVPPEYNPAHAKRFLANKLTVNEGSTGISALREQYDRPLSLLMATTGLVLLIACANLANLLLARATVREREIAVRLAIGASRWRLVHQLLAESFLLAAAGTVFGGVLAVALSRGLIAFISASDNPVFVDMAFDWRAVLFMAALAVFTCLLFGLLPALRATILSPSSVMRSGGRSITAGRERFNIRRGLVALQVALSLVLLVGALLFVRSLHNLMTTDSGFHSEGVLSVSIDISKAPFSKERRAAIFLDLSRKFSSLPGVVAAAEVSDTPVSGSGWDQPVGPDGTRAADSGKTAYFNRAAPGYFRTMGTQLLAGRDFDDRDTLSSPQVAIVTEMFARKYFGGANPVGHTFHREAGAGHPEPLFQIVGMVANSKYYTLREDFLPIAFFPIAQNDDPPPGATFVLRVAGSPARVIDGAKAAISALSPAIGVELRPFSAQLEESLLREKLMATLSGGFGLLAGLLSTLGLYGVIAYMVARRRNEMGVRIALGANSWQMVRLILREAIVLVAIGLSVGFVLVLWAGKWAATLLYGLAPNDFVSLAAAGLLLTAVALMASYLPARRAAAIEPIAALREE